MVQGEEEISSEEVHGENLICIEDTQEVAKTCLEAKEEICQQEEVLHQWVA